MSAPDTSPHQKPTKPFPAWRVAKGMNSASDEDLRDSVESCERWEWFGGGLVVFGVLAAVAIAWFHPAYDSWLEQWGSVIADGLVAFGVVTEIKFGQMAGLRQAELTNRSNKRLANVTGELVRIKSPRSLSDEQGADVASKMREWALIPNTDLRQDVAVFSISTTLESAAFANRLAEVLGAQGAGWNINRYPVMYGERYAVLGIGLLVSGHSRGLAIAGDLASALAAHGILATVIVRTKHVEKATSAILTPDETRIWSGISIMVGDKP